MKTIISFLFVLTLIFTGCSGQSQNQNANVKPSPSPTPTKEEIEQKEKAEKAEQNEAINLFVSKNYAGWQLKGISESFTGFNEITNDPFDLYLVKGKDEKVVTVLMKKFVGEDGESYLLVYEAKAVDLTYYKIQKIKDEARTATLENLTEDDVNDDLKVEIATSEIERLQEMQDSYEPPDPF